MSTDDARQTWRAEQAELDVTLAVAKTAANRAISDGERVPEWATARIRRSIEEEGWWDVSLAEGYSIGRDEIPDIVDSIDTVYFDGCLPPGREEGLSAGAVPTDEERIIHRNVFLKDLFDSPQNWENELTFYQVFEVRGDGQNCCLIVVSTGQGQGGAPIDAFEFFAHSEAALDWLRLDNILDFDFRRWRAAKRCA